jgi:hypothetical protein
MSVKPLMRKAGKKGKENVSQLDKDGRPQGYEIVPLSECRCRNGKIRLWLLNSDSSYETVGC